VIQLWDLEKGIVKHGIVCIIHTFSYDIKWDPHSHLIVTEGGLTSSNTWRSWSWNKNKHRQPYISFSFLQSKWRELFIKALFSVLEECWDKNPDLRNYIYQEVIKIKKEQYRIEKQKRKKDHQRISFRGKPSRRDLKDLEQYVEEQQWYVNAESRFSDGEHTIEYIGRYSNRSAMAECHIVNFDGNNVTFWYDEKKKLSFYVKKKRK
jgi:hypothetical protein